MREIRQVNSVNRGVHRHIGPQALKTRATTSTVSSGFVVDQGPVSCGILQVWYL